MNVLLHAEGATVLMTQFCKKRLIFDAVKTKIGLLFSDSCVFDVGQGYPCPFLGLIDVDRDRLKVL